MASYGGVIFVAAEEDAESEGAAAVRCIDPQLPYWSEPAAIPVGSVRGVCGGPGRLSVRVRWCKRARRVRGPREQLRLPRSSVGPDAPLPIPRYSASAVGQGCQLYVIGGRRAGTYINEIVRYDTAMDTWVTVAALSQGLSCCGGAVDGERISMVRGRASMGPASVVGRFGTRSLKGSVLPPLPQGRRKPAVFLQAGVHVAGGAARHGRPACPLLLTFAPVAAVAAVLEVPAGWTETAGSQPQPDAFAGLLTGM